MKPNPAKKATKKRVTFTFPSMATDREIAAEIETLLDDAPGAFFNDVARTRSLVNVEDVGDRKVKQRYIDMDIGFWALIACVFGNVLILADGWRWSNAILLVALSISIILNRLTVRLLRRLP
jgi:lysylphosphatidylglycerol synthetase-like protein (DUF2156 family)